MSQTQSLSEVTTPRLLFSSGAGDGESRRSEGYLAQDVQLAQRFRIWETQVRERLERPGNAVEIQCLLTPWLR
jgi:hypothetical protein